MEDVRMVSWVRPLFLLAAAANGLVAVAFALPGTAVWRLLDMRPPDDALFVHFFCLFVALFGAANFAIGLDPSGKRPLMLLSAWGKLLAFTLVLAEFLAGAASARFLQLIAGDLVFALLFFRALRLKA